MALEALLGDPATFLGGNLLINGFNAKNQSEHRKSGVFEVGVRTYPDGATRMSDGTKIDRYAFEDLDKYNTNLPRIRVYYCHYDVDEMHMLVVDTAADLMLTPTMDGCSFGVGSEAPGGARLVGHVNVKRQTGGQDAFTQAVQEQDDMIRHAMPGGGLMSGGDYRAFGSTEAGTTIGVRKDNKWGFYTQFWNRPQSTTTYFLRNPAYRKFA